MTYTRDPAQWNKGVDKYCARSTSPFNYFGHKTFPVKRAPMALIHPVYTHRSRKHPVAAAMFATGALGQRMVYLSLCSCCLFLVCVFLRWHYFGTTLALQAKHNMKKTTSMDRDVEVVTVA